MAQKEGNRRQWFAAVILAVLASTALCVWGAAAAGMEVSTPFFQISFGGDSDMERADGGFFQNIFGGEAAPVNGSASGGDTQGSGGGDGSDGDNGSGGDNGGDNGGNGGGGGGNASVDQDSCLLDLVCLDAEVDTDDDDSSLGVGVDTENSNGSLDVDVNGQDVIDQDSDSLLDVGGIVGGLLGEDEGD